MEKKTKMARKQLADAEGLMTYGVLENGLHTMDFTSLSDAQMEECTANFKVRAMRDGNVYMTEIAKQQRNHALFRDDNASLSLGRNGKYYFVFTMDEQLVDELPQQLVRQASAIAQKVANDLRVGFKRIKKG